MLFEVRLCMDLGSWIFATSLYTAMLCTMSQFVMLYPDIHSVLFSLPHSDGEPHCFYCHLLRCMIQWLIAERISGEMMPRVYARLPAQIVATLSDNGSSSLVNKTVFQD
jgi:hypothetical protein